MYRAGFILGVAVWLTGEVSAQDTKPPATEIAPPQAAPTAPLASGSELRELASMVSYTIELKVVEGKGQFGDGSDDPSPNADFTNGIGRRASEKATAPGTFPLLARPQVVAVGSNDAPNSPAKDIRPTMADRKSEDVWDFSSNDPRARTIMAPRLTMRAKQSGFMAVENPQSFAYLEPFGNDDYHLKRTDIKKLGMKFTVEPRPVANDEKCVEVSLDIETTTLDGREAVEGLDLDVGKPIVATRSLKTTAKMKLGVTRIIAIPSGPATQAVLMLRVKRFELPKKD
jgi:hypothetical protein